MHLFAVRPMIGNCFKIVCVICLFFGLVSASLLIFKRKNFKRNMKRKCELNVNLLFGMLIILQVEDTYFR